MTEEAVSSSNPLLLPDRVYDILKRVALVLLPAVSTLYFMLGEIWGWSNVTVVIGTLAAIDTFLGTILGISTRAYNKSDEKYDGSITSSVGESGVKVFTLELNSDPDTIEAKKSILFKVDPED